MKKRQGIFTTAVLAVITSAACSDSDAAGDSPANAAYQELSTQLQNCADNALNCLDEASCDDAAEQVCRDDFRACRKQTRAAYRAFHAAVRTCFGHKWECVSDAGWGDAGADARQRCREAFQMCVTLNRPLPPPAGPCMQGLRECVQADVMPGERASKSQFRDCLSAAHQCVLDRLPMCDAEPAPDAGGATAGAGGASGAEP